MPAPFANALRINPFGIHRKVGMRSPTELRSGFWPGLEGHGYEGAHEDGGEKLAEDGFRDGERAREWKYGHDVAADGGQRSETVEGELRGELVQIGGCGNEAEGAGMKLFNELIGGGEGQAEKKVGADAALDAAPGDRACAKRHEQNDADVEQQRDRDENAAEQMKKKRRMHAPGGRHHRSAGEDGDHHSRGHAGLVHNQRRGNHQHEHGEIEEDASAKAGFAHRRDDENKKGQGDGDKSEAQVAGPELADVRAQKRSVGMRIVRHEKRPPMDCRPATCGIIAMRMLRGVSTISCEIARCPSLPRMHSPPRFLGGRSLPAGQAGFTSDNNSGGQRLPFAEQFPRVVDFVARAQTRTPPEIEMNYKTKVPAVVVLALASSLGAESDAQSASGTVVVIGWSQTKIVIAVDSRGFDDAGKHRDDICKIVRLDDHSVFTAAGNIIHARDGHALWDAQEEARHAFQEAQNAGGRLVLRAAARSWGERMVASINRALAADPAGSTKMVENNIFLTGVFLGFQNGITAMYQVEIACDPGTRQAREKFYAERPRSTMHFAALGRNEIVSEVVAARTHFARVEQRKWAASERNIPWRDRDVRWAIRLVQLTMEYHPQKIDVGGPTDALEMTRRGIRWVERKPGCNP